MVATNSAPQNPTTTLPQSWLTGLVASNLAPAPPNNDFAQILADRLACFKIWRQHVPTTILPQSWLTGMVASNLAPTLPNNDFTQMLADRLLLYHNPGQHVWLLQTRRHNPTTTLPQSWLTGLVASNFPTTTLPQSWLTGLVASNLAPTPPNNDFTPIPADGFGCF